MSFEGYRALNSEPDQIDWMLQFAGNGTGNPTTVEGSNKYFGKNVRSVVRTSIGLYTITYADAPGNQIGFGYCFQAATPSSLAGFTGVFGNFDATGKIITFSVFNQAQALTDLTSTQTCSIIVAGKRAQASI